MGLIKDFLFGRKIKFHDNIIGELSTRVKSENPSNEYTWAGDHLLQNQACKTVFILEGNINGPYKLQLAAVYKIVNDLQHILTEVNDELKVKHPKKHLDLKDWTLEFYLAAITPNDVRTNQFEVTFEPADKDDLRFVSFLWTNGRISEVEAKS